MKKIFLLFFMVCSAMVSIADTIDDARQLLLEGDYWQARKVLDKAVAKNPKVKNSPQYSYILGACELEDGNFKDAESLLQEAKKRGVKDANLYLGRLAFLNYDLDTASELYGEFKEYVDKNRLNGAETVREFEKQLASAENSLERVENIVVIDSLAFPAEKFFKYYKLPPSAGKLLLPEEMPLQEHGDGAIMAYINEGRDFMMWGEPDSIGNSRLVESVKLLDGTWQEPTEASSILSKGGYADYPFMMPDGVTLYFASTGNDSMGGYDIFVASRDATTGEYLQPLNVGMPFNSPYDDYMLAVDEENGVGWWATDRNLLGDKVTVYVYLVNDLRKNYDADDENLVDWARLSDYKATWKQNETDKYEEILSHIDDIDTNAEDAPVEFMLPIGNGRYYTNFGDFQYPAAKEAMKRYLAAEKDYEVTDKKLQGLYHRYSQGKADNVKQEILKLENEIEQKRSVLTKTRGEVYRSENITK